MLMKPVSIKSQWNAVPFSNLVQMFTHISLKWFVSKGTAVHASIPNTVKVTFKSQVLLCVVLLIVQNSNIKWGSYLCSGTCVSEMTMFWSIKMSKASRNPRPTALSAFIPDSFSNGGNLKIGPSCTLNTGTNRGKKFTGSLLQTYNENTKK